MNDSICYLTHHLTEDCLCVRPRTAAIVLWLKPHSLLQSIHNKDFEIIKVDIKIIDKLHQREHRQPAGRCAKGKFFRKDARFRN